MPAIKLVAHQSYGLGGKSFVKGVTYNIEDDDLYATLMSKRTDDPLDPRPIFQDAANVPDTVRAVAVLAPVVEIESVHANDVSVNTPPSQKKTVVLGSKKPLVRDLSGESDSGAAAAGGTTGVVTI